MGHEISDSTRQPRGEADSLLDRAQKLQSDIWGAGMIEAAHFLAVAVEALKEAIVARVVDVKTGAGAPTQN